MMISTMRKEAVPKEPQLKAGTVLFCTLIKYLLKSLSSYTAKIAPDQLMQAL